MLGVTIDRIAIVVGNSIIKDSDVVRDLRVTAFLNSQPLSVDPAARKAAANRLIDQVFIRREIRIGDYPRATMEDAEAELTQLEKQRFKTPAAFQQALRRYGLADLQLREQFQWELTVLRFIDARFRPAVLITDEEIQKYYNEHAADLRREHPGKGSLEDLSGGIRETLTGEQVNKLFFAWLDEQRAQAKIKYFEESLR
ncbi:MAG: hypothetical protein JOY54_02670 [Acidobacteriaceae bacterium]|nr:hypothetical protein [Acidobacteriaceae bacterium]